MTKRKYQFTLTETIVVLIIAAMMAVLVIPVVGRIPNRVAFRQAETAIESAFSTAARRARATGETVELTLNLESREAVVSETPLSLPPTDMDPPPGPPEKVRFELPKGAVWDWDEETGPVFTFLPNGQAEGPEISYTFRKKSFFIVLDNLTGKIDIQADND